MTKLEEIQRDIEKLSREDVFKLSEWLAEYFEDLWDRQIEEDAKAGRLDKLAAKAIEEIKAGKVRSF
jgi:hypothetical protein